MNKKRGYKDTYMTMALWVHTKMDAEEIHTIQNNLFLHVVQEVHTVIVFYLFHTCV